MSPTYQTRGRGEPLLVLSGYGVRASVLRPVVAQLAERFTCLTFDYPVTGGGYPFSPLTVPAMAAAATAVLDRAGYASAHVLGISMGGMVAQELAIRFPHRVRGLVLAATTPGGPCAVVPAPGTLLAGFAEMRSALGGDAAGVGGRALLAQTVAASLHDTSRRLSRIRAATLIVHGDRDVLVPLANAHLLHRGIPGSTLEVVSGVGHGYFFSNSVTAAARISRFIEKTDPRPGPPPGVVLRVAERADRALAPQVGYLRGTYTNTVRAAAWLSRGPARGAPCAPPPARDRTRSAAAR